MPFTCQVDGCGRTYQRKEHLNRHMKDHDKVKSYECSACGAKFSRGDTLRRHMNLHGPRATGPLPARVAKACASCHKSKTRCDGLEPTCTPCADRGRVCFYPSREAADADARKQQQEPQQRQQQQQQQQQHPVPQSSYSSVSPPSSDLTLGLAPHFLMVAPPPPPPLVDTVMMDIDTPMDLDPAASQIRQANNAVLSQPDPHHQQQHQEKQQQPPPPPPPTTTTTTTTQLPPPQQPQPHPSDLSGSGSSSAAPAAIPYTLPMPPKPAAPLHDPRTQRLVDVYFSKFHHLWPLVHKPTFAMVSHPDLLIRAVVVIGLFFEGSPEARELAVERHGKLLKEAQEKTLILSKKARQGIITSPTAAMLPHLQAILLVLILTTYRHDRCIDVSRAASPQLAETLERVGAYSQARIDAAAPLRADRPEPFLLREGYQRLALLHYKLHLLLSSIFVSLFPWARLDRSLVPEMLHVRVPLSRHWWDRLPASWHSGGGGGGHDDGDPAAAHDPADDAYVVVSSIVGRARAAGTTEALMPVFAWDRDLALALGSWCTRPDSEPDERFVQRLNPYIMSALSIGDTGRVLEAMSRTPPPGAKV